MYKQFRLTLFVVVLCGLTAISGCAHGTSSLMVQLCVNDDEGVAHFKSIMQAIAASNQMQYIDGSAESQRDLKIVGAKMEKLDTPGSVINIGIEKNNRNIVLGGNLGLPAYQIALGFSSAPDPDEGQRFARLVVTKLRSIWKVEEVAGGGVLPMKGCPGKI